MSGHNKWSKIKRAKGIKDKEKGNIFAKIARLVTLAVIEGGGVVNPDNNVKLRLAIEKAKSFNLPKENIQRAIEKGHGPDKQQLKEIIYEAFGPQGTAFIILATSDNAKRTLTEVRNVVESHGGKLGNQGSVMHLFRKSGPFDFEAMPWAIVELSNEDLKNKILELVEALENLDDVHKVYSNEKIA